MTNQEQAAKLADLVTKWHKDAMESVPSDYADRDLHYKYLRLDNRAAGLDEAADDLAEALAAQPAGEQLCTCHIGPTACSVHQQPTTPSSAEPTPPVDMEGLIGLIATELLVPMEVTRGGRKRRDILYGLLTTAFADAEKRAFAQGAVQMRERDATALETRPGTGVHLAALIRMNTLPQPAQDWLDEQKNEWLEIGLNSCGCQEHFCPKHLDETRRNADPECVVCRAIARKLAETEAAAYSKCGNYPTGLSFEAREQFLKWADEVSKVSDK